MRTIHIFFPTKQSKAKTWLKCTTSYATTSPRTAFMDTGEESALSGFVRRSEVNYTPAGRHSMSCLAQGHLYRVDTCQQEALNVRRPAEGQRLELTARRFQSLHREFRLSSFDNAADWTRGAPQSWLTFAQNLHRCRATRGRTHEQTARRWKARHRRLRDCSPNLLKIKTAQYQHLVWHVLVISFSALSVSVLGTADRVCLKRGFPVHPSLPLSPLSNPSDRRWRRRREVWRIVREL